MPRLMHEFQFEKGRGPVSTGDLSRQVERQRVAYEGDFGSAITTTVEAVSGKSNGGFYTYAAYYDVPDRSGNQEDQMSENLPNKRGLDNEPVSEMGHTPEQVAEMRLTGKVPPAPEVVVTPRTQVAPSTPVDPDATPTTTTTAKPARRTTATTTTGTPTTTTTAKPS